MKILITGGAGFIGSHIAEYYGKKSNQVVVFDNLSRAKLLNKKMSIDFNWQYLKQYPNIQLIKGDIRDFKDLHKAAKNSAVIIHTAGQTGVTTSLIDPKTDFEINALGTFNVLEAAKNEQATLIYCSTNKVYGNNVNKVKVSEKKSRYVFADNVYQKGIPENFSIDLCEHTPYGSSKLAGDIYVQDYAQRRQIKAAVFRMSCIYGDRQFGFEDQGWISWFTIAALLNKKITIYGNGKQVRDILYIDDLIQAFNAFIAKRNQVPFGVYNLGGGIRNTLSLLELIAILEKYLQRKIKTDFKKWRESDQKVYVSDIRKAITELDWKGPKVNPESGVLKTLHWTKANLNLFR